MMFWRMLKWKSFEFACKIILFEKCVVKNEFEKK